MKQTENAAIIALYDELHKLGGAVFARYMVSKNKDANDTIKSYEFLDQLFNGELKKDDEDFLEPYLKPLYEVNNAIKVLEKHYKLSGVGE